MKKILTALSLSIAIIAIYILRNIVLATGILYELEEKGSSFCQRVDVFPGTEDVTIDRSTGIVFVSADDRRTNAEFPEKSMSGGIFAFHIDNLDEVKKVSLDAPKIFHPHGMSLWQGNIDGRYAKRLMVINHLTPDEHRVELFDIGDEGILSHAQSIAFDALFSPNDLVAVGPRSFYATNDRRYHHGILSTLESYLSLPLSSAVFYDGQQGSYVVKGLKYANGINISKDGASLYIAEVLGRRIGIYERNLDTGELSFVKSIALRNGPDNIDLAEDGKIWVAGHPNLFAFLSHITNPDAISPSQIQSIDPNTSEVKNEIVLLKGEINGASVAAFFKNKVVIGAVYDGHVLVCDV